MEAVDDSTLTSAATTATAVSAGTHTTPSAEAGQSLRPFGWIQPKNKKCKQLGTNFDKSIQKHFETSLHSHQSDDDMECQ